MPEIPPLLLEGDVPAAPSLSGPGRRYVLGPTPPVGEALRLAGGMELPEAYGTKRLFLTARDPHWLYAHWDLTRDQLRQLNRVSRDGHLIVRVHAGAIASQPVAEVHVHPESRNWFIHVEEAGARYVAQLGYYPRGGKWVQISASGPALTPPDSLAEDTTVEFASLPVEVPLPALVEMVKTAVAENVPLVEAIQQLRATGHPRLPDLTLRPAAVWTPRQERALAEVISMDEVRRVWVGSLEITELVRRQLVHAISSAAFAELAAGVPAGAGLGSLSSPFGGPGRPQQFWFNINAELIIYGATEPDAAVTIGGRAIKLRPDGSFSFRFALPDGRYELPAVAVSVDGTDTRSAELQFSRQTRYGGEVTAHPQDPRLKPPAAEHLS